MRDISDRLQEREEELADLKRLFVEKLRELESSFVELSQDMIESETVQMEASRRYQQKKSSKSAARELEKSLEQVIGKIDDDGDEQLEQLAALNEQLSDENRELREQVKELTKELENNQEVELLRAQNEEFQNENEQLENEL